METPNNKPNTNTTPTSRPGGFGNRFGGAGRSRSGGPRGPRFERVKPEYDQKVIDVRRVARVMAGGRRFSFSVVVVIGNRKGKVGVGVGKAMDTSLAIDKAVNQAKKNMIIVPLTKENGIDREISAKFGSSKITARPAHGRGLVAGSALRTVFELAGIHHINAKILSRSKNKLNIARAGMIALRKLS
ncbi:MAG: 30S ribosomal protein S5 [Patescibacteria group bacterium]